MKKMMWIAMALLVCASMVFAAGSQDVKSSDTAATGTAKTEMLSGGLGGWPTVSEYEKETGQKIAAFKEAPMLSEMVSSGEIPALKDRLPLEPAVVEPVEWVGTYGGTLRHATTSPNSSVIQARTGYDPLVRWSLDGRTIIPGIAKSWEVSPDGKVFDFFLREGMKWSDGAPFTADDIIFRCKDIDQNKELNPSYPTWLTTKGEPVKVEKINDYQVRFTFAHPNGLFLENIAFRQSLYAPKHYLKKFHPDYITEDELNKLVKEGEFDDWVALFGDRRNINKYSEVPVIRPWVVENADASLIVLKRNPYYWKVDTDGNQLPYIDTRMIPILDQEVLNLKSMSGELDFESMFLAFDNYTLFLENQEKGGYRVVPWNRAIAEPEAEVHPEYLDYNPEKANELLDSLGLKWDTNKEYRLDPNGNELSFVLDSLLSEAGNADLYAMIQRYWKEVGIRTSLNSMATGLWQARVAACETAINPYGMTVRFNINSKVPVLGDLVREKDFRLALSLAMNRDEINAVMYNGLGLKKHYYTNLWEIDPLWFVPTHTTTYWAPAYGLWYMTEGREGEEPTGIPRELQILYDEMIVNPSAEERARLSREIWGKCTTELYNVNILTIPYLTIIKNDLRNVKTENVIEDYRLKCPGYLNPAQWFFKK